MRNFICSVIALIFLSFGCSTKSPTPTSTGVPNWDYEKDALGYSGFCGDSIGSILGALVGGVAGALGGTVRTEIQLDPTKLLDVFEIALSEPRPITPVATSSTIGKSGGFNATLEYRWRISEINEGQIITDWRPIKGKTVGLLWWKKQYFTEVRHIIKIFRSYRSQKYSNFSIETQVRERPNPKYDWSKGEPELGRESFSEIKNILLDALTQTIGDSRIKSSENK